MSILGGILAGAASLIPGVGPIVSLGVAAIDQAIGAVKQRKDQEGIAAQNKSFLAKQERISRMGYEHDSGSILASQYSAGKMPELTSPGIGIPGQNTYLGDKFGLGDTILGRSMELENFKT